MLYFRGVFRLVGRFINMSFASQIIVLGDVICERGAVLKMWVHATRKVDPLFHEGGPTLPSNVEKLHPSILNWQKNFQTSIQPPTHHNNTIPSTSNSSNRNHASDVPPRKQRLCPPLHAEEGHGWAGDQVGAPGPLLPRRQVVAAPHRRAQEVRCPAGAAEINAR
jgi:hypothetical protein